VTAPACTLHVACLVYQRLLLKVTFTKWNMFYRYFVKVTFENDLISKVNCRKFLAKV